MITKDILQFIPQRHPFVMVDALLFADEKTTRTNFMVTQKDIFCEDGVFSEAGLLENIAQTVLRNTVQRVAPELLTTPVEVLARAMCFNAFTKDHPSIEILNNHAIFRLSEQQPFVKNEQSKASNQS